MTLSNGVTLEVQEQASARLLRDIEGSSVVARKGMRVVVRHWPPGRLELVKATATRLRDIMSDPVEGVDYELV